MKKLVIVTTLLLLAGSAMATETRVLTMGDNNTILLDEHNIALFPSRLFDYPNLAIAEFDNDEFTKFGVHWQFNKERPWVLGTYFHDNTPWDPDFNPVGLPQWLGSFAPADIGNQRMDLYYARKLGMNKFGFHFGLVHSSAKQETDTYYDIAKFQIYRFDFGFTPEGDKFDLSAGLELLSWTDETTYYSGDGDPILAEASEPDGNKGFYFIGRMFHKVNDVVTLVPHAGLRYGKYNMAWAQATDTYVEAYGRESKVMTFEVAVGMQYVPAENVLAVLDFGFAHESSTTDSLYVYTVINPPSATASAVETKEKVTSLPFMKIGFDADVFKWRDVRFGATSYWNTETDDEDDEGDLSKETYKYPDNETYLGFGFHWNRLNVDVYSNPEMFMEGFNFLSGATNDMNFRISAVYEMM